MKIISSLFLLISFSSLYSLELDEKLFARILDTSDSKRTILVNKGREHGLVKGDHAKFSTPEGMFGRAVVVKISPSRSVWSIYRPVDESKIVAKMAFVLKIATPIKLTTDESRELGILAKEIDKKEEEVVDIDPETAKRQKILSTYFTPKKKTITTRGNQNYSNLDESGEVKKRDRTIDWSALDGEKDLNRVDSKIDFSNLR